MQMYNRSSSDEKDPDQFGKLLLQMHYSTKLLIANGVSLWPNTNGFTCRKHNGNSVIDYVLLSKGILNRMYINSHLGNGHRNPIIELYVLISNVCIGLIVRRPLKIVNNCTRA